MSCSHTRQLEDTIVLKANWYEHYFCSKLFNNCWNSFFIHKIKVKPWHAVNTVDKPEPHHTVSGSSPGPPAGWACALQLVALLSSFNYWLQPTGSTDNVFFCLVFAAHWGTRGQVQVWEFTISQTQGCWTCVNPNHSETPPSRYHFKLFIQE